MDLQKLFECVDVAGASALEHGPFGCVPGLSDRQNHDRVGLHCTCITRSARQTLMARYELFDSVVWSFFGDDHVVDVTLAETGRGDSQEPRLF